MSRRSARVPSVRLSGEALARVTRAGLEAEQRAALREITAAGSSESAPTLGAWGDVSVGRVGGVRSKYWKNQARQVPSMDHLQLTDGRFKCGGDSRVILPATTEMK
jgi:hypothetical protein